MFALSSFCSWIFYTYIYEYFIRIYQYFSCLHSLYRSSATHSAYLPLPLLSNFFSCSSQRRIDINVIFHLTIISGFQLNRSGLENKRTEAIGFFPICTTKTMEGGACIVGGWTGIKRMKTRKTCLYMPFTSHTKFHTPDVHAKKAWYS